jgi:hypothetical protein
MESVGRKNVFTKTMDMIRLEKELYGRIRAGKRLFEG